MTIEEFLTHFDGVKRSGNGYMALCPAHNDHNPSLSISPGKKGGIVLHCHTGCTVDKVLEAVGLSKDDIAPPNPTANEASRDPKTVVAKYRYKDADGKEIAIKIRKADKTFWWIDPNATRDADYYKKPKGEIPPYNLPAVLTADTVYIVEGEKDVDTLTNNGIIASCSPDGAGKGKWRDYLTVWFKGKNIVIIQDNDDIGKAFAQEEAQKLHRVAQSVKVIDLTKINPKLKEHGDITDLVNMIGAAAALEAIKLLIPVTPEWTPLPPEKDPFLSCFKSLDTFTEEEATWLVPGWIPESQITLLAADGGVGKTTLWCNIAAAHSCGKPCVLDPPGYTREPSLVAFLTTEDSVRKKLKKQLRLAGADMNNIMTPDFVSDKEGLLKDLKFGSAKMEQFLSYYKPKLVIFDPVQGFVPPEINMGARNAMRDCMAPLIVAGEKYHITSLVICHSNKRKGAYARDRIADSADLWDISRSVIMAGYTSDRQIRYLSNEKNNYAKLQDTVLFSINDDGLIQKEGTTWKRDREYMQEAINSSTTEVREDCKKFILDRLAESGGTMKSDDLSVKAKAAGYSIGTLRRAKDALKAEAQIRYFQTGSKKEKTWYTESTGFAVMPPGSYNPFEVADRQGNESEQMKP